MIWIAGGVVLLIVSTLALWLRVANFGDLVVPGVDGRDYMYVEEDGSARELTPDELEYLGTAFHPADGNRPYIKGHYKDLTPDRRTSGFLPKAKLPSGVRILD
ncbi:MAG: hypothetical protein JWP73_2536 [Phenylobacterium sp.]|nr:hypothetical protein [Phenylobacterium sp.]